MNVEFDQRTFRRLVKLYLWILPLLIVAEIVDLFVLTGMDFSDAFDALAASHFSPVINSDVFLGIAAVTLVAHLVGTFALLRFKNWARPLFGITPIAVAALDVINFGYPTYASPLLSLLTVVDIALYGAIVLLCYGKEQGDVWFNIENQPGI